MSAVLKQGIWTPEKRLEQSAALRARKIWLKSTGPRTAEGKAKSSINARKAGYEERQKDKRLRNYLRLNRLLLNLYTSYCEQWPLLKAPEKVAALRKMYFFKNELSVLTKEIIDGLSETSNIIPFPKPDAQNKQC